MGLRGRGAGISWHFRQKGDREVLIKKVGKARPIRWASIAAIGIAAAAWLTLTLWKPGDFSSTDLFSNLISEALGIAATVLFIDTLHDIRATQQMKDALTLQMGSPDNSLAIEAVRLLRLRRWGFGEDKTLRWAGLDHANLQGAELEGVNLPEASLCEANLEGADLGYANLEGGWVNFANLAGARLGKAYLARASLQGANLRGATLVGANLKGADLLGAMLQDANFQGANITDQQLARAHALRGATMRDGSKYDGRFNLVEDKMEASKKDPFLEDASMADFYGISLERYKQGQEWGRENAELLRRWQGEKYNEPRDK